MPKKERIQKMFDGIAPSYDRLNHIMSLGVDRSWRRRAVREAVAPYGIGPGKERMKYLDVACGTGDFTIALAKAAPMGSRVVGVDISSGMMGFVMRKAAHEGVHDRIKLKVSPAESLPFEDASFDCVTCAFGIRNFEDKEAALQEFLRVLRPGGKLVILELSVPTNELLRKIYDLYFMHIMPWIGGLISSDREAYRYLPASVHAFPPPVEFCGMIGAAGFSAPSQKAFTMGLSRLYTAIK